MVFQQTPLTVIFKNPTTFITRKFTFPPGTDFVLETCSIKVKKPYLTFIQVEHVFLLIIALLLLCNVMSHY